MAQNAPYVIDVEAGKKAFCACGNSANLPFCDGSHKGTDKSPTIVEFTENKRVAICGCTRSGNLPYCDGSHAKA